MAKKLYSSSLTKFDGEIPNQFLLESLAELSAYLHRRKLNLLTWDEKSIAIQLPLDISIPPLGTADGIDIQSKEDILIVLNLEDYPQKSPVVYTDRLNFPKDILPHLFIAKDGKPPAFCLVRGNKEEWYANKRLSDVVTRTKNWLRDAALGELSTDGNQFDPLRLEGYAGSAIYPYNVFAEVVNSKKSFTPDQNFSFALFENTAKEEDDFPSFKFEKLIEIDSFKNELAKYLASLKDIVENKNFNLKRYHFGYLLWPTDLTTYSNYDIQLPRDWKSFIEFCKKYDIDLTNFESFLADIDPNILNEIPVVIALRRPKKIIGFSSNIEFINFYFEVSSEDKKDEKIINNIPIHFQQHNEPLTTDKAKEISGSFPILNDSVIIGCGALGSKIVTHFFRNGQTEFLLLDNDKLSPHNLVRHSLFAEYEGMNKALALSKTIRSMYRFEKLNKIIGLPLPGNIILDDSMKDYLQNLKVLFDFTASESFFNELINTEKLNHVKIFKANISNFGNLGILFIEGGNRNPRLDDLQILLYSKFESDASIQKWLENEKEAIANNSTIITVGVGCNSETTILPDEIISIHASLIAGSIKSELTKETTESGKVYEFEVNSNQEFSVSSKLCSFEPLIVLKAINNPSWEIRLKAGLIEKMKMEMGLAMPVETGGVFVGCANYKTKTIHVVDLILAPPDSKADVGCFFRGISGLPDKVDEINKGSGGQLGYIGEWHTHPFGPNWMSTIDQQAVNKFKREFENLPSPLPVFLMIVTPTNILPFVF